jgi:hypothetical protein
MSIQRWRVSSHRFLDDEGDYVLYADHIKEIEPLKEALKELRDHHSHCIQCNDGETPDVDDCLVCLIDDVLEAQKEEKE